MSLTPEQIESNWKRFRSLCEKTGDQAVLFGQMLDELEDRLCLCPASAKRDFHACYPGGLVEHSLRVLNNVVKLKSAFKWGLNTSSMIIAALFHDIGKLGMPGTDPAADFYLPQTDSWRAEKLGEEYKYNNDIPYMSTPDRSLFVLQHYGIRLSPDQALAIKLNDGWVVEENRKYCLKVSPLVFAVQTADMIATMEEKNVKYWPSEEG